jgi:undecaprenyl-diphosphatase
MTWLDALKVGIAQCFALIPGTSRSGATIIGGMLFGLLAQGRDRVLLLPRRADARRRRGYDLWKNRALFSADDIGTFAVGFIAAFISAFVVIAG